MRSARLAFRWAVFVAAGTLFVVLARLDIQEARGRGERAGDAPAPEPPEEAPAPGSADPPADEEDRPPAQAGGSPS